jgi:hypothetical protein
MQERRMTVDRRGSRPDAITFSIPIDEPLDHDDGGSSPLWTRVILGVTLVVIVALAAWWGSGHGF